MTICNKQRKVLTTATRHVTIVGTQFLFGELEVSFPGFATRTNREEFVRVMREGASYFVTEVVGGWELHRIKDEDENTTTLSGDVIRLDIHGKETKRK